MIHLTLISILEVLLVIVPALLSVAYVTVAERKTMASMQRRLGPNAVGYYGLLQAFADALKLLLKEYVAPTQANIVLFFLGPVITLIFALLGYGVIPYGPGLAINDFNLGILYMLAVSSLATYGILLAGWSANSKYAFLGSLRSTAQLISYELILSSALLLVIMLTGSLNLTVSVESQRAVWFILPLLPIFIIFFIGSIAEYGSIVLMCILTSLLFLGGYLILDVIYLLTYLDFIVREIFLLDWVLVLDYLLEDIMSTPPLEGLIYGFSLGLKSSMMIFTFIWARASFPRIRFDQLMSFCWTVLLPIVFAFIIIVPCILYSFDIFPFNLNLF